MTSNYRLITTKIVLKLQHYHEKKKNFWPFFETLFVVSLAFGFDPQWSFWKLKSKNIWSCSKVLCISTYKHTETRVLACANRKKVKKESPYMKLGRMRNKRKITKRRLNVETDRKKRKKNESLIMAHKGTQIIRYCPFSQSLWSSWSPEGK